MPKYPNNNDAILTDDTHFSLLERRGRKFLKFKRTKRFDKLSDLELEVLGEHVWAKNDKLFRLSLKYYGTIEYWWVLGSINKKPTDAHYEIGDILFIPSNPTLVVEALR